MYEQLTRFRKSLYLRKFMLDVPNTIFEVILDDTETAMVLEQNQGYLVKSHEFRVQTLRSLSPSYYWLNVLNNADTAESMRIHRNAISGIVIH